MSDDSGQEYEEIDWDEDGVPSLCTSSPSISKRPPMPIPVSPPTPAPKPTRKPNGASSIGFFENHFEKTMISYRANTHDSQKATITKYASPGKFNTLPTKFGPSGVAMNGQSMALPGLAMEAPPHHMMRPPIQTPPMETRPPLPPPNRGKIRFGPTDKNDKAADFPGNSPYQSRKVAAIVRSKTFAGTSDLPPLPPKPLPKLNSVDLADIQRKRKLSRTISQDYIINSEELTLTQLVDKYQESFPLCVRVCKGFYGSSDRTSVSEGDSFNIHFVKKSKVVNVSDSSGSHYKIAMNSAIEFGVLYNPNNNRKEAQKGFTFERVSDILASKKLPKAIRASQSWKGSGPDSSVDANELLLVRGTKTKLKTKYLKVFSPAVNKKKALPEHCIGRFSTRPYDVRVYLPEIMHHLKDPFPLQAVLFINSETAQDIPVFLMSSVVTLKSQCVDTSLIATSTLSDDITKAQIVDIPFDLDIEVQVMTPKDRGETKQLYQDTRQLLETFDPSRLCPYLNTTTSDAYDAQAAFYNIVREGDELEGVDLVKPSSIYVNLCIEQDDSVFISADSPPPTPRRRPSNRSPQTSLSVSNSTEDILEEVKQVGKMSEALEKRVEDMETTLQKLHHFTHFDGDITKVGRDITSARADMKRMEGRIVKASEEIAHIKNDMGQLVPGVERLVKWCEEMQGEIKELQRQQTKAVDWKVHGTLPPTPTFPQPPQSTHEATWEQNKQYLAQMDCVQVIHLLDAMGLKLHHNFFMQERINGEILLECDDNILERELKITSRLHRVRLLKLISGQHSAESILKGDDPYVYASKAEY